MSLPKLAARLVLGYVGVVESTAALIRFRERTAAFEIGDGARVGPRPAPWW
jgi:hypothetical protein